MYAIVKKTTNDVMNDFHHSESTTASYLNNLLRVAVMNYGGEPTDYQLVSLPDDMATTIKNGLCRKLLFDGQQLHMWVGPRYTIDGSTITVHKGWVQGQRELFEDDVTDFTDLGNTDDIHFKLELYRAGETISVILFTRAEDEDYDTISDKTLISLVVEGIVHAETQLVEEASCQS